MQEFQYADSVYMQRVVIVFICAFVLIAAVSKIIGEERKAKWFRKRTKYTLFTRRSILGEWVHFGYPCTWQGLLIFFATFGSIFSIGYLYIFH